MSHDRTNGEGIYIYIYLFIHLYITSLNRKEKRVDSQKLAVKSKTLY
jgi:hypothetical protein